MDLFEKIDIFWKIIFRPLHAPLLPRSGGIKDFVIRGREGVFFKGQSRTFRVFSRFSLAAMDFAARVWRAGVRSISQIVAPWLWLSGEPLYVEIG